MSAQPELWRVSTPEGVFEADLETLRQWIVEGAVLPTDKVTKGTQSWIEAGRVPKLKAAFAGEYTPPDINDESAPQPDTPAVEQGPANVMVDVCHNHPGVAPEYLCRACNGAFCAECTRFVGATRIPLCPSCGELCHVYQDAKNKKARAEFQQSGFGFSDFTRAVSYPFQHKTALLVGALIYGFSLLVGYQGTVIARILMFACISHVICQVAWGRLNRSFMPDFSSANWDDFTTPGFLGVGILLVTWGPMIALVLALTFGMIPIRESTPVKQIQRRPVAQSSAPKTEVNPVQPVTASESELEQPGDEKASVTIFREVWPYIKYGGLPLLLFVGCLAWAFFYYPMALTVAGYTESVGSVVNPIVGLDTIRRMGLTYFKAFAMVAVLQIVDVVVAGIVGITTGVLTPSFIGNLLANFFNGVTTFYFNLVIACVLGLSLHKCADRLDIAFD